MKTVAEFREECKKNDDNIVRKWDYSKFKLICQKCLSEDCYLIGKFDNDISYGCDTCGPSGDFDIEIVAKCHNCGHAMAVEHNEGY